MKEPHVEGVAIHDDPESCEAARKVLSRSVDRGTSGLGIEPRNQPVQSADAVKSRGRQHDLGALPQAPGQLCAVVDPTHVQKPPAREPGDPVVVQVDGGLNRTGKADGRNPVMHDDGKSDEVVVPEKSSNKIAFAVAETMEGRTSAKANTAQQNASRTQSRNHGARNALDGVRQIARRDKKEKFTALMHHVTLDRLRLAFARLHKRAAAGVDGITWEQYRVQLEDNLLDLHSRLRGGAYRAKPSRRVHIPKPDGGQRPLGVAALEDKLVQSVVTEVMNAIYEQDFVGFSYGFRPGRGQHDALDALYVGIYRKKVNYVLDADIRGFFDTIDHGWLQQFLEHRISDRRLLRLIQKWLSAGVLESGAWSATSHGTPQGATISPLLANVYMHYVFDLWIQQWRKRNARGDIVVVRYADDFIVGFQYHADAVRLLDDLRERLRKFSLELHPEKTRLIAFGSFTAARRKEQGLKGRPETFNFLGFTHICATSRSGRFLLMRRTRRDRFRATLKGVRDALMRRRHMDIPAQGAWLGSVVRGYFQYHAVPTNIRALQSFRTQVERHWQHALSRRSQRGRPNWTRMRRLSARWLPTPKILHPSPTERFDANSQGRSRVR